MSLDEDLDLAEAVDADLVATFGPRRASACGTEVDPAYGGTSQQDAREQRAAYLYPIVAPNDHAYRCIDCGSDFERGLGCIECLGPTCAACVRQEKHACVESLTDERTLTLVAAAENVSRERVRQVEYNAISRLRHSPAIREIERGLPLRCHGHTCSLALGHIGDCLARVPAPAHERGLKRQAEAVVALAAQTRSNRRRRQLARLAKEERDHIDAIQYKIQHEARRFDVSQLRGLIHEAKARLGAIQQELERELKRVAAIENALDHERIQ